MIFNTKGFTEAADSQVSKLQEALVKASRGGVIPIVCDTSPCLGQLKSSLSEPALKCAPLSSSLQPGHMWYSQRVENVCEEEPT